MILQRFDEELKEILFSDETLIKINDNDPKLTIELIKILIEKTLNLKGKIKEISHSKSNIDTNKQEENDYIMLYHHMESQLLESRKVFYIEKTDKNSLII